jgi:phosphatidylglycerol:prolipoprotein diacylglycerol transferase
MSSRRGFRPPRHRQQRRRAGVAVAAAARAADATPTADSEGLSVTHWFDPGTDGVPYAATVRFAGRRTDLSGKPGPGDTFSRVERIDRVVPGSGPISVTALAYGINAGEWSVTAELTRSTAPALPGRRSAASSGRGAQTLPRARWSWRRWRLSDGGFAPVRTGWGPLARLTAVPAVVHGSWITLVSLGIIVGTLVQIALLSREGVDAWRTVLVTAIAVGAGIVGAKIWYVVLRPREWRRALAEGWSVDGSIVGAPLAGIVAILALGLPLGAFLDASTPAFFIGVAIGRIGCFFTGCCAGRCTASRWGIWSSDRRVGARRIPTQLLESAVGLVLFGITGLAVLANVPPVDGVIFGFGVVAYLVARQLLLRLRADARSSSLGMEGRA